jgi:hypothetical protein
MGPRESFLKQNLVISDVFQIGFLDELAVTDNFLFHKHFTISNVICYFSMCCGAHREVVGAGMMADSAAL